MDRIPESWRDSRAEVDRPVAVRHATPEPVGEKIVIGTMYCTECNTQPFAVGVLVKCEMKKHESYINVIRRDT